MLEVLAEEDIERIDRAALKILERTGVAVYDPRALDLLEAGGAQIDRTRSRARLPERLVAESLEKAPEKILLGARDGSRSVTLGDGNTYFTNSATGIKVLDHKTGEIRQSVLSDIPVFARVADALKNIGFHGPTVVAHDVPGNLHFLHEMVAAVENTSKHVTHESHGVELTKRFIEVAHVVAGGEEEFRKRPVISAGGCPVSPLQFDRANTEAMLECAKAGMPFDVLSMAMGGGTAPITLAGELAVIHAEVLAGVTMCQLAGPGCPVIYGSVASVMDMRTGILALGAPERAVLNSAVVQMAHYHSLPCLVGGISTDGKMPGEQVMMEKVMTGLPAVLAGADIVFGPAVLSSATTYSVEQLVVDDEAAGAMMRIRSGMDTSPESLALELVEKVGPGGGYIGTRHTMEHSRKSVWMPELTDRNIYENWVKAGSKDLRQRARQKIDQILAEHETLPLEEEQRKDIQEVLRRASSD